MLEANTGTTYYVNVAWEATYVKRGRRQFGTRRRLKLSKCCNVCFYNKEAYRGAHRWPMVSGEGGRGDNLGLPGGAYRAPLEPLAVCIAVWGPRCGYYVHVYM